MLKRIVNHTLVFILLLTMICCSTGCVSFFRLLDEKEQLQSRLNEAEQKRDELAPEVSELEEIISGSSQNEQVDNKTKVNVVDALDYEKEIIVTPQMAEIGWEAGDMKHRVRLPKITLDTVNSKAFNRKLYDTFDEEYEKLLNNQEASQILMCDYEYKLHNGIIGIVIETNFGAQAGGVSCFYNAFYYDSNTDTELTFEQYINALGLTKRTVWTKIIGTSVYSDYYGYGFDSNDVYLKDCIIDRKGTIAYLNDMQTMDGWSRLDVESVLE